MTKKKQSTKKKDTSFRKAIGFEKLVANEKANIRVGLILFIFAIYLFICL